MNFTDRLHKIEFDFRLQITVVITACALVSPMFSDDRTYYHFGLVTPADKRAVFLAIGVVCALTTLLRIWGTAYLSSRPVMAKNVESGTLVTSGPYAYVRNPLYLSDIIGGSAVGVALPPAGFLIISLGLAVHSFLLALYEERNFAASLGPPYAEYKNSVGRFVPRLSPFRDYRRDDRARQGQCGPSAAGAPDFRDGFLSGMYFFAISLSFIVSSAIGGTLADMDLRVYVISLSLLSLWGVFFAVYYHPMHFGGR